MESQRIKFTLEDDPLKTVPSNGVRLRCGVRLMVTKTNHFNTEFVLKTPPTAVYISFHVYLTRDTTSNVMSVHYLVNSC